MRYINKYISRALLLLMLLPFVTSCLQENYDGCSRGIRLKLQYTHNPFNKDRFNNQITSIDVFIYAKSGELVKKLTVQASQLDLNNTILIEGLNYGEYSAVVWGNRKEQTFRIDNEELIDLMKLSVKTSSDGSVDRLGTLFHGMVDFSISMGSDAQEIVDMIKSTSDIHVIIEDLSKTKGSPDADFSVRINGKNGAYYYDNSLVSKSAEAVNVTYLPEYGLNQQGSVLADFTVLRMFEDKSDNSILEIRDTKNPEADPIFRINLAEKIMETDQNIKSTEDFDKADEHTIVVKLMFNGTWAIIGVTINNWDMKINTGGI